MSASWFEALADSQVVAPVKHKIEGREKRLVRMEEDRRREEEEAALWGMYRAGERERREKLLAGPHGREIRGLIQFLRTMTLSSADALVTFMDRAAWVKELSADERDQVWSVIFRAIAKLREKNGLSFWEDSLDGSPKVFDQVERALRP